MAVRSEQDGMVRIVTIDRADRANAIDLPTSLELSALFDELEHDEATRAVVLTGAGARVFSAGMDLEAVAAGQAGAINGVPGGFAGIVRRTFEKPLVAAVNGAAIGGGFEIVLACDLVVAAANARFALPEVTKGLFPASGGAIRLPVRMPHVLAMECMLLNEPIGAERALELGLVNRVVPPGDALPCAVELATRIAQCPAHAVQTLKRLVSAVLSAPEAARWALNDELASQLTDESTATKESSEPRP